MHTRLIADVAQAEDAQHLAKRIFAIAAFNGVAALAVIIGFVGWMASAVDELARRNSDALFQSALQAELDSVALSTADYAYWTAAYEWVRDRDQDALYDNFGSGATESPTFDFIYILDPAGQPLFAYQSGGESSDLSVINTDLTARLVPQLGSAAPENKSLVSTFAASGEDVAASAITRITPDDMGDLTEADLPIMIAGTWLTEERLMAIGKQLLLTDVSLQGGPDQTNDQRATLLLAAADGATIAGLRWTPPRPSRSLLATALPVVLGLALITLLATLLIGRTSARQTTALLQQRHLARTDQLTGLPNRAGLAQLLKSAPVARALETGNIAVAYLDLNDFKKLNDSEGHDAGDLALQIFAERVRGALRAKDSIIRLGGDEFACILLDENPGQTAEHVARRIMVRTAPPVRIGDTAHAIAPSIGVAIGAPGITWQKLIKNADTAMYYAKSAGTHDPVFYADSMNTPSPLQRALAG